VAQRFLVLRLRHAQQSEKTLPSDKAGCCWRMPCSSTRWAPQPKPPPGPRLWHNFPPPFKALCQRSGICWNSRKKPGPVNLT